MLINQETQNIQVNSLERRLNKAHRLKVAYIMSRFPKLTETFVLYEMLAMEQLGVQVEVYPLLRVRNTGAHQEGANVLVKIVELFRRTQGNITFHPESAPFVERANFAPFFSLRILRSHLHFLLRKPLTYFGALWTLIRATWGSPNFFLGALSIFPKTVYFAHQMENDKVTHVHAHFANHPAAAAFIIHRLVGIPYSFTAHGADLQVDQHMLREKVREAAFVVAISNFNKEFIIEKCGAEIRDRIKVIHCGVDTSVFSPTRTDYEAKQRNGATFTILCIGTMYEVKGHIYLINACQLLKEQGVDFICYLVGDGPFRTALEEQVEKLSLNNCVFFHGQRTHQEISDLLKEVDTLVLPSIPTSSGRREGIPVVLMEAMASGVPVVASGISGIPELVEDGVSGLLVRPRDPEALATALKRLDQDPALCQRLGQEGRNKVLQEFDLHTNADLLANSIEQERIL
jgi:colanic acid/amylovoran biosynthesis glycosyltransferase